jgi:ubiquinone/menaquinone biosynthesis C-methylase UbiE
MPSAYDEWLVPTVFAPFAVDLVRRVAARSPRRVLELAAGTGVVTRELLAVMGGADVVATDVNQAMVDVGRAQAPAADWRRADAMALPFVDGSFDVVVCQFGVMFFPDKQAAFGEARRVLAPSGAFVFNTWAELERHTFQAAVVAALVRTFPDDPPTFLGAVPHGYADVATVLRDLRASGFPDVEVDTLTVEAEAPSALALAAGYCQGTPLRAEIETRGELDATTSTVAGHVADMLGARKLTGSMTAHVITACQSVRGR